MYNGRYNEKHDFLALEIVNGDLQFSFSLGSNVTRTFVSIPGGVSDGNWHSVTINYYNKVFNHFLIRLCSPKIQFFMSNEIYCYLCKILSLKIFALNKIIE